MFIIDDILLSPVYGVVWLGRKLHHAAQEELASEKETITSELSELYMMLETGRITEAEFDAREKEFLDRLEEIEEHNAPVEDEDDQRPEVRIEAREKELLELFEEI